MQRTFIFMAIIVAASLFSFSMAQAKETLVLFGDQPVQGFYGSGWKGAKLTIVGTPTRNHSKRSLRLLVADDAQEGAGATFYTKKDVNCLDISHFQAADGSLRFFINAPEGYQDLMLGFYNSEQGFMRVDAGRIVRLSQYVAIDNDPETWQEVSIALKDLASVPYKKFSGIQLRYSGHPSKPLFIDDLVISTEPGMTNPSGRTSLFQENPIRIESRGDLLVPTFECLGVYWSPEEGSEDKACEVSYRETASDRWMDGFPLWFDRRNREYRGSIVHLNQGTEYEVRLNLSDGETTKTMVAETWPERFPVAKTITLPETSSNTLTITESGSPDGYVLYARPSSSPSVIDVNDQAAQCVVVDASYVILRGLVLKGASADAIRLRECHDVVIEECDISGWGRILSDGWGADCDAAIASRAPGLTRIVVQRNKMHHPRSDSNNWREPRPTNRNNLHPNGPQAVVFWDSNGNHVIRHNKIYSDADHYFNDCLGAGHNFSFKGFPNRDSDIHGNYIANCWDDGIESEGANCNVRIWGNFIEKTYMKIATASTSYGPLYIWRNVAGAAQENDIDAGHDPIRGGFLKTGRKMGGGKIYLFHNTLLQPPTPPTAKHVGTGGSSTGLGSGGPIVNLTSRNNMLHVSRESWWSIVDKAKDRSNDFDFDLYNGRISGPEGSESNGIRAIPIYDSGNRDGEFALSPSSPGIDQGERLPNFNSCESSYIGRRLFSWPTHGMNGPPVPVSQASAPPCN